MHTCIQICLVIALVSMKGQMTHSSLLFQQAWRILLLLLFKGKGKMRMNMCPDYRRRKNEEDDDDDENDDCHESLPRFCWVMMVKVLEKLGEFNICCPIVKQLIPICLSFSKS